MRRPSCTDLLWACLLAVHTPMVAQNLDAIGREKPFAISGGFSFNQISYTARGIAARRNPYTYVATGHLNVSLYGWSVPLNFTISPNHSAFAQPFNHYALHPRWKWITLHAGYTSATYSAYTVNGHIFRGAAMDLQPSDKWRFNVLHGRLLKAVEINTPDETSAFRRNGLGLRIVRGAGSDEVGIIFFHASDDPLSIATPPDSLRLRPQENIVASLFLSKSIFKRIVWKGELASSALTRDTRSDDATARHPMSRIFSFFTPRVSTSYYEALKTSLDYQRDGWMLGVAYERIDPGYQTLGAYYFNNDLENITVNGTARILRERLTVNVSAGVQRDNIDDLKLSSMRRMVSACNLNYTPSAKWNVSASWSAFQTFTNVRSPFETPDHLTPYDYLDTLTFTQISRNASTSAVWQPGNSQTKKQTLTVNITWQKSADEQGEHTHSSTAFYNFNAGYSLLLLPSGTSLSFAVNASMHRGPSAQTYLAGPTASVTRSLMARKLKTGLSVSWNGTRSHVLSVNKVLNARLSANMTIARSHHLTFSAVAVQRTSSTHPPSVEITATVGYQCSLSGKAKERFNDRLNTGRKAG